MSISEYFIMDSGGKILKLYLPEDKINVKSYNSAQINLVPVYPFLIMS